MEQIKEIEFWTWSDTEIFEHLGTGDLGLSTEAAKTRLLELGPNSISSKERASVIWLLWRQVRSPLIWILVFAAIASLATKEWTEAGLVIGIILISAAMGFVQEFRASKAIQLLLGRIAHTVTVRRDGTIKQISATEVVPGDLILLNAGTLVPADGVLIKCKDLYANQAVLTGESMPAEKEIGPSPPLAPLTLQKNVVFAGTSIRSGIGEMIAVKTGETTRFGQISKQLQWRDEETDFEKNLKQFGYLLTQIMISFVLLVSVGNVWLEKPLIDSLLFSIALAVGLSPELLPAVLTVTLAKGALRMAKQGVIVRRLNCIESLGNITVLCCDKTGTLTSGVMSLKGSVGPDGTSSARVAELAFLNAHYQTGIKNPLDDAIVSSLPMGKDIELEAIKVDEIPYDFIRRRLTVVVSRGGQIQMIMKGAVAETIQACRHIREDKGTKELTDLDRATIMEKVHKWGGEGYRTLALASRYTSLKKAYSEADEENFTFEGFLIFHDPPHPDARISLVELKNLGINTKIVTGDNRFVAEALARSVGYENLKTLTGEDLNKLNDEALLNQVISTSIFAEVDPQQKEMIIRALMRRNLVVGYMGDGINDAPALRAADVGISVETAVDVAKESADLILTTHDLKNIIAGIVEGRVTFANTLKYIFITTSANFGNMVSMAVASFFLPFLPLLGKQVLLNNLLSDIPALAIGTDSVDHDWKRTPHRWDNKVVRRFMIGFGVISSIFDILMFLILTLYFHASPSEFRTAWFLESLLTEILIVFVVRTFKPAWKSRPSSTLVLSSLGAFLISLLLLTSPVASYFEFVNLRLEILYAILSVSIGYVLVCEAVKRPFMRGLG